MTVSRGDDANALMKRYEDTTAKTGNIVRLSQSEDSLLRNPLGALQFEGQAHAG
jgi:hypothetical protein